VTVGKQSVNSKLYRIRRLLRVSKTDIKLYDLSDLWREKDILPEQVLVLRSNSVLRKCELGHYRTS
jgi:hypothetical protein